MTPLLVLTGILLVGSALGKLHAAGRAKLGTPILSLIEAAAGLLISVVAFVSPPTVDAGFRMVVGGILLMLVSSATMVRRLAQGRRQREDSEGLRLRTYVKYISGRDPSNE